MEGGEGGWRLRIEIQGRRRRRMTTGGREPMMIRRLIETFEKQRTAFHGVGIGLGGHIIYHN